MAFEENKKRQKQRMSTFPLFPHGSLLSAAPRMLRQQAFKFSTVLRTHNIPNFATPNPKGRAHDSVDRNPADSKNCSSRVDENNFYGKIMLCGSRMFFQLTRLVIFVFFGVPNLKNMKPSVSSAREANIYKTTLLTCFANSNIFALVHRWLILAEYKDLLARHFNGIKIQDL